jgi:hypothetical protein
MSGALPARQHLLPSTGVRYGQKAVQHPRWNQQQRPQEQKASNDQGQDQHHEISFRARTGVF